MNVRALWLCVVMGPVACLASCDNGNYSDVQSSEKPRAVKRAEVLRSNDVFFAFPCDEPPPGNSLFLRGEHTAFRQELPDQVAVSKYLRGKATIAILTQEFPTEYAGMKDYAGGDWSPNWSQELFIDNATAADVQVTIDSAEPFTVAAMHHVKVRFYLGVHNLRVVSPKDSSVIDARKFFARKFRSSQYDRELKDDIAFLVYNVQGSNRYTCRFHAYSK